MHGNRRPIWLAFVAAVAAAGLLCLPVGASAHGLAQALAIDVTGPGTVTSSPAGINCRDDASSDCAEVYGDGTSVTLTATPDSGASFAGWGGFGCSGTSTTCTVLMDMARAITATFTSGGGGGGSTFTLTVNATGNGAVTGTGISCGNGASDCTETYSAGTSVTLTETPASGATFTGWGGPCSGTGTTCTVVMNSAQTVSATFTGGSNATLVVSVSGSGKVTGTGIDCGNGATDCSETFALGASVTLTETPASGATFTGWGSSCTGTATTCVVQMTTSKAVTAQFSTSIVTQATLTVTVTGSGRVTGPGINCGLGSLDCSEIYTTGSSVTLAETPASGASFVGWGGSCGGATSSCTVVMTASKGVSATFSQGSTQKILTVTTGGSGRVSGPGISCGVGTHRCSTAFDNGTGVTLLATPASGAIFLGWGGACGGTQRTCHLVMDSPKAVSASFSTPGATPVATLSAHSLGAPLVVRNSIGWGVTLRFFTTRSATALLRLSLNGRLINAFTFSPHAGTVLVGPFNVLRSGQYRFRLTLSDSRGATAELNWNLCLSTTGCGSYRPAGAFVRSLGVTAARTASGWTVQVRFQAYGPGTASIVVTRSGRYVSSGSFSFRTGAVNVTLHAYQAGLHRIVLTARSATGRTYRISWNVVLTELRSLVRGKSA